MNIRYVVSYIDKDGLRRMLGPNQGRNTYGTYDEAWSQYQAVLTNNSSETLISVYGKKCVDTFAVSAVECYPSHNDPKGIYIMKELNPNQDIPEPWKEALNDTRFSSSGGDSTV